MLRDPGVVEEPVNYTVPAASQSLAWRAFPSVSFTRKSCSKASDVSSRRTINVGELMQVWNWCNRAVITRSSLMPCFCKNNAEPPLIMVYSKKALGPALFVTVFGSDQSALPQREGGVGGDFSMKPGGGVTLS